LSAGAVGLLRERPLRHETIDPRQSPQRLRARWTRTRGAPARAARAVWCLSI